MRLTRLLAALGVTALLAVSAVGPASAQDRMMMHRHMQHRMMMHHMMHHDMMRHRMHHRMMMRHNGM